jgi:ubiquinone/menaquinone biosynthesis C-methylase UbiE
MAEQKQTFASRYYDRWSDTYETGMRLQLWFWRLLGKTRERILLEDGKSVYDLGCGTGNLLQSIHEEYPNAILYGSDVSEGMISKAKAKFRGIGENRVRLKISDMNEPFPWDDEMFDYVVTTYCFHHSKNPAKTLQEVFRVLKPGGTLYLADLCYPPVINWLVNIIYPRILRWKGHIKFIRRKRIRRALNNAGFTHVCQKRISPLAVFSSADKP